ncbi:hypothetical protein ANCDUO_23140 [Ancylostoma duodenale]|uniref:SCP domain-containing protein n=1 Tax=Ancylostoma duodenale TaxID=51022 RepID=A0A0C2FJ58_9BILA|nr:hypothetical protein ANCDUO_23140 [Ancylostoma duodenale]
MPYATKMNELTWDCGLEHNAWLYLCNNSAPIYPNYTETATATINTKTTPCNITSNTLKVLKNFSKESDAEDLSGQNPKRTNNIGNFAVMIAQAAKGFACTYQKCDGSKETAFVCLYDTVFVLGQIEYDCHGIGQDAVLSVYCTTKQFNPASGNSLNHKEYSLDFTPANALQQMAVAQATKFAYTARQCRPEGYTVAVCQYNR